MKKYIIIGILLCVFICQSYVYAAEYDSYNIPDIELNMLQLSEEEVVIKLYHGMFRRDFAERRTIHELIDENNILGEMYMISPNISEEESNYFRYLKISDGTVKGSAIGSLDGADLFFKYTTKPELLFDSQTFPNIAIENIYCLDGELSHNGMYIYYVTSQGDYVYYKEYPEAEHEYLFPVKDFYDFAATIQAEIDALPDDMVGGINVSKVYDMTPFEVGRTNDTNPFNWQWIVIAVTAVAVISITTVTAIYLKKRKTVAK